jgi:hypothetical protein
MIIIFITRLLDKSLIINYIFSCPFSMSKIPLGLQRAKGQAQTISSHFLVIMVRLVCKTQENLLQGNLLDAVLGDV